MLGRSEPLQLAFDHEGGDRRRAAGVLRSHVDDDHVGLGAVGDPHLRAVRDPAVVDAPARRSASTRGRRSPPRPRSSRARRRARPDNSEGSHRARLLGGAVRPEVVNAQVRVRAVRQPDRCRGPGDLFHDHEMLEEAELGAAVFRRRSSGRAHRGRRASATPAGGTRRRRRSRTPAARSPARRTRARRVAAPRARSRPSLSPAHPCVVLSTLRRSDLAAHLAVRWPTALAGRARGGAIPRPSTHVDTGAQTFRGNVSSMHALVDDLRARLERVRGGGGRGSGREARGAREAHRPRPRRRARGPGCHLPRVLAARRRRSLRRRGPRCGHRHWDRSRPRSAVRRGRERRHREGRHLFPRDGEETPPRPEEIAADSHLPCIYSNT